MLKVNYKQIFENCESKFVLCWFGSIFLQEWFEKVKRIIKISLHEKYKFSAKW